jgi:hypothetical protein
MLTLLFFQSGYMLVQVLVAERRVGVLIAMTAAAVGVQATILALASTGTLTLETAAWSAVIGQAVLTLGLLVIACRLLEARAEDVWRFWARVPLGWALLGGLILGIDAIAPEPTTLFGALVIMAAELAVFVVIAAGIVRLLEGAAFRESIALLRGHG